VVLNDLNHLASVRCRDGREVDDVTLFFANVAACKNASTLIAPGAVLVASAEYKCDGYTHHRAAGMLDLVVGVQTARACTDVDPTLQVSTRRAELHHAFRHARLRLVTNSFADPVAGAAMGLPHVADHQLFISEGAGQSESARALEGGADRLGCWFCFLVDVFKAVVHTIVTIATVVDDVISGVATVIGAIATGDFSCDGAQTIAFINRTQNVGFANGDGTLAANCTACGFQLGVDLVLEVDIASYKMQSLQAYVNGSASLVAHSFIAGVGVSNFSIINEHFDLETWKLPPVFIMAGPIPVDIQITIPVTVGWSLGAAINAGVEAQGQLDGSLKFGVSYDPTNDWQYLHDLQLQQSGQATYASLSASLTASLWVMPTVVISIDYIGGPSIALKATAETTIYAGPDVPCTDAMLNVNMNLDSTIAANFTIDVGSIHIATFATPALTIFSKKWPVFSGCFPSANPAETASNRISMGELDTTGSTTGGTTTSGGDCAVAGFGVLGTTWSGNQTCTCSSDECATQGIPLYLDVFAQTVPADDGCLQLLSAVSGSWLTGGYCVSQAMYSVQAGDSASQIVMNAIGNGDGTVDFNQCSSYFNDTHVFNSAVLQASPDLSVLSNTGTCSLFILEKAAGN